MTFHSLVGDFLVVRIPVPELQELLETLHVPGGKETKPSLCAPGRPFRFQRAEAARSAALAPALAPLPALNQTDGRRPQQVVGQQVDLLHDVGQSDRQLLSEEGEGRFLTRIF